jgi:predicted heme/steroid binding protein
MSTNMPTNIIKSTPMPTNIIKSTPMPTDSDTSLRNIKQYTLEELSKYNGYNQDLPTFTSFNGNVYNVSLDQSFTPKFGAYGFASDRDVTFAFVNNCFNRDCLISDVSGINLKYI